MTGAQPTKLRHLVIIPDGNRRFARARGLVSWRGHRYGFERFKEVSEEIFRAGIPFFTFWVASRDNLEKRSAAEVGFLIKVMREALEEQLKKDFFDRYDVRVRFIGPWRALLDDERLNALVERLERQTSHHRRHHLTMLLGYDGVEEMLEAVRLLVRRRSLRINPEMIKKALWTGFLPPVDLIIRTGTRGDPHLSSGLMMWHTTYSQLYFTKTYWPAFGPRQLRRAIADFARRPRRYGK